MSRIGNIIKNYSFTLNNRILLYFILILSICDLMFFSIAGEMLFFFIFIITGYLTSFFSKNMIVILVVAMTVTHCLRYGKNATGNEGMANKKESFDSNTDATSLETAPAGIDSSSSVQTTFTQPSLKLSNPKVSSVGVDNETSLAPTSSVVPKGPASASTPTVSAIDKLKNSTAQLQEIKDNLQTARVKSMATPIGSFNNSPAPASSSFKPTDLSDLINNTKIDSPLAINNSKPVVSGFENLDAQTKKLLNTQQELMLNMDNLSPLLAQAEKFMEKFQGLAK